MLQQLLTHCFDDIERFVGRLQQAAESFKELDRRRQGRDKKQKQKGHGGNPYIKLYNIGSRNNLLYDLNS